MAKFTNFKISKNPILLNSNKTITITTVENNSIEELYWKELIKKKIIVIFVKIKKLLIDLRY